MPITEWEFTADAAGRINEFIQANAIVLPFGRAKVEQRRAGSQKRRDLTILGPDGAVLVTGEVKMPWTAEGHSPFVDSVCADARQKAKRAGVRWFFTWNVNELVLWLTRPDPAEAAQQPFRRYQIATVSRESDFDEPYFVNGLKAGIATFLLDLAKIVAGQDVLPRRPPDDYFIESLESFLERPIQVTNWALVEKYRSSQNRDLIDRWMLKDQGWTLSDDPADNLRRVARATTYAVANKLVFYEALRRTFGRLPALSLPARVKTGEQAFDHLIAFFARAKDETRDYETVFGFELNDLATRIPFYPESGMDGWRSLIDHIERFDFSRLDYDVIGRIFERLIGPEERHKYGQYYTRPEVVDLINSFCIDHATATVLDPACGGGTFLVRAYARKRAMAPQLGHVERLSGLYGVDVSPFAAQLTTINLASRQLVEAENYPRVIRSDFFDVRPGDQFMVLPGLGNRPGRPGAMRTIPIEPVDAIVGNPPYVRQEDIRKARNGDPKHPPPGTKEFFRNLVQSETGVRLSGRSDLHCYFWGHAAAFLRPSGRLGFLTSSQWLDVDYGFPLQRWLLQNFRVVAILESRVEPWFVGARVVTAITIAYREPNRAIREDNSVRFVELRKPLAELLLGDGTSAGMIDAADQFRDLMLGTSRDVTTDDYRVRLIPQRQLWHDGVTLGRTLTRRGNAVDPADDNEGPGGESVADGEYFGGKWGLFLRAPDLWFQLIDRTRNRWSPLSLICEVRRGITTGADEFFYVRDASQECLAAAPTPAEFMRSYGVARAAVARGEVKLIKDQNGEAFAIEAEFLVPVVLSLMQIEHYRVTEADCTHLVLMIGKSRREIQRKYVARYIERGERLGYHLRPTCAGRVTQADPVKRTNGREWFDLTGLRRGKLFWTKSQQYRHIIPVNPKSIVANCNLYDVFPSEAVDLDVIAGVLNSSIVLLSKMQFGRPVGVEGALKTEVIDVNMMLVPDPRQGSQRIRGRVAEAFAVLAQRPALSFLSDRRRKRMTLVQRGREAELGEHSDQSELDQADRRALDDAVLELLGVESRQERLRLLDDLYRYLSEHFEKVRQKEEEAIRNKKRAATGTRQTVDEIVAELLNRLKTEHPGLLLRFHDLMTADVMKDAQGLPIPKKGRPEIVDDMVSKGVRFATGPGRGQLVQTENVEQARLLAFVAEEDGFGRHEFFPVDAATATRLLRAYQKLARDRAVAIRQLAEARTADPELQEQIIERMRQRLLVGDP